jgi:hypothetical protein
MSLRKRGYHPAQGKSQGAFQPIYAPDGAV